MGANRKLLQLAKGEPFRLRDARELRPLNGLGGQRLRGKRLFQSVPAKDARYPQPPARGLSLLRKRAVQNGGRPKRSPRFPISLMPGSTTTKRKSRSPYPAHVGYETASGSALSIPCRSDQATAEQSADRH